MKTLHIGSVLVASDLSPESDGVITSAAALAARHDADIHILHSVELTTVPYSAISAEPHLHQQTDEARARIHEQATRCLPPGTRAASEKVRIDNPPHAILERAREVAADLIVIGPARPKAFRGTILGNTSDHILRTATVPVLVLRHPSDLHPLRIVVPFDLGDPARGALDVGLKWACAGLTKAQGQPEVVVLYVISRKYEGMDPPFDDVVIAPQIQLEVEDAKNRLGIGDDVLVRLELIWGDSPADAIVQHAQATSPELLVMGTHGYGALGRALIGSVSSRVVRAATCPMLLVPAAMWGHGEVPPS